MNIHEYLKSEYHTSCACFGAPCKVCVHAYGINWHNDAGFRCFLDLGSWSYYHLCPEGHDHSFLGGGNSNIFHFSIPSLGFHDPIWLAHIFSNGLVVQPPTSTHPGIWLLKCSSVGLAWTIGFENSAPLTPCGSWRFPALRPEKKLPQNGIGKEVVVFQLHHFSGAFFRGVCC